MGERERERRHSVSLRETTRILVRSSEEESE